MSVGVDSGRPYLMFKIHNGEMIVFQYIKNFILMGNYEYFSGGGKKHNNNLDCKDCF